MSEKSSPEARVREIHRKTRRRFSSEEKIRIVLEGLKAEESVAEHYEKKMTREQAADFARGIG